MRESIKQFVKLCAETLPVNAPIYEFGSLQVAGQEGFADLRPFFPGKEYVGCDMREGVGVDKILNLHAIDLPDNSVGTVLCFDTLEHVEFPYKAVDEIYRILKPGGLAAISSVMDFPIHDYPSDYWRFTPETFKNLLKSFTTVFVGFAGAEEFPHTVVGIGIKEADVSLAGFKSGYEGWSQAAKLDCPDQTYMGAVLRLEQVQQQFKELRKVYDDACEYVRHVEIEYNNAIARVAELERLVREKGVIEISG